MIVEFRTESFEFAHGHAPRGHGYWGFKIGTDKEPWFAPGHLSFKDAKKAAEAEARKRADAFKKKFGIEPVSVRVEVLS
jgi:hypothetical protein